MTMGFLDGSVMKNPPSHIGDAGWIPGSGRSPGGGNGNPLSVLAWKIPWTEEPGMLQSTGSQTVGHSCEHEHGPTRIGGLKPS